MKTKDYLNQYKDLAGRIERDQERIEQIEASIQKSIDLDGLPHGTGTSDPTKDTALKLVEIRARLKANVIEAEYLKQTIADEIERVRNPQYKELLYSRYIKRLTWEDVTDRVSRGRKERYDSKHIRGYMHGQALREFEKCRKDTYTVYMKNIGE